MITSGFGPYGFVWLAAFVITSVASAIYFWFGTDPESKRQLYPWATALTAALFLGFAFFAVQMPSPLLAFFALIIVVSGVVHIRRTVFCPKCARMVYRGGLITRVNFCPRCGQPLDAGETSRV